MRAAFDCPWFSLVKVDVPFKKTRYMMFSQVFSMVFHFFGFPGLGFRRFYSGFA